ncbi:hypothetical protein EBB07_29570 [Paenibacillaceae bacterium]|nr:hypothetical protein EBB07_29570 [Paenibacillaceae bacterium]
MGNVIPREDYCEEIEKVVIWILIKDQKVVVVWNTRNKAVFQGFGYIFTSFGDSITVELLELTKHSRTKVNVECDYCKKVYKLPYAQAQRAERHLCSKQCRHLIDKIESRCYICNIKTLKNRTQMNKRQSEFTFCSLKCVGSYNSKVRTTHISKDCLICNKPFKVKPSTSETQVVCSIKCQASWQSMYLRGESANNFKGGNVDLTCSTCTEQYSVARHRINSSKFCSQSCKQDYWKNYILHNEAFKKAHYEGNLRWRANIRQTLPEKMVREWLVNNNIDFMQEQGFFHKYYADFWLKNTNIIIEVFGDYWHANPLKYNSDNLNEHQKAQIIKDEQRLNDFKKHGFNVLILWEDDIYNHLDKLMKDKLLTIYPLNDYT